ncbi:hypothetical protein KDM41_06960 [bacterium]|nr:hypothetical protein [bacterium]
MKPVPTLLHLVIAAFLAGCANEHDGLEQAFHPADDFGPSLARMGYDDPQLPELAPGPPPGAESDATSDAAAGDGDAIAAAMPVPARLAAAPNPFNPVTELRFALPKGGARVILAVHGVDGREVARLLDAHLPEGEHRRVWRGQDGRGRKVPSGVYFVLLHAGEEVVVRKVVVVK